MLQTSTDIQRPDGSAVPVLFGAGALGRLGELAAAEGARRVLLVSDPGIRAAGHVETAVRSLYHAGLGVHLFDGVEENPTTQHVDRGLLVARRAKADFIIALGGGSSMDCAKGINFVLTNGGRMQDYWGVGKATKPMLPLIAIPTTAGTGSEAQSFALIADPQTHQKMACGDRKALPRLAILDPDLTATQPPQVAANAGIDAVTHAVETAATTRRTDASRLLSRHAWRLLRGAFTTAMADPSNASARADMLLGAHLAGAAIENSMLGAAHACANPLTARYGIPHGMAVGLMLPWVVRFNTRADNPYGDLMDNPAELAAALESMLNAARLPRRVHELKIAEADLPALASLAAQQWTAQFNPRPVTADDLLAVYESAM